MTRTIGSLFSGIGGLELGLERAGLGRVAWQCEIDPFCRSVLAKHWPDATRYEDVRKVGRATATRASILCGGFPCQDVSLAGLGAGLAGARSGLWFEYARIIAELAPSIVVIENVLGLRTRGLRRVLADLSELGFDAEWCDLWAWDVGAPHRRARIFIVATHPDRVHVSLESGWLSRACRAAEMQHQQPTPDGFVADPNSLRRLEQSRELANLRGWSEHCGWDVGPLTRVDDGLPRGLDVGARRKALGNAVNVACARVVGLAIAHACEVRA
jgi:DNA (cytosine-5)-methyltransferase 1